MLLPLALDEMAVGRVSQKRNFRETTEAGPGQTTEVV
jgi:hypothetical protein